MSDEQCAEFTASRGFNGERLRCSFNWRFTVTKDGAERKACTKHMRKLRADGWKVGKQ